MATALLAGSEGAYVDWLFDTNTVDPGSITAQDQAFAARALQARGALAAASKTHAAWSTHDGPANEASLAAHGKWGCRSSLPVAKPPLAR